MSEPARIGVLGRGNVGAAFVEQLEQRAFQVERISGRRPELAGVPAVAEIFPGFFNDAFYGFVAPPGTPDAIVKTLNAAIVASLKEPDVAARMKALGLSAIGNSPTEAAAYIRTDSQRWRDIIAKAGIKGL